MYRITRKTIIDDENAIGIIGRDVIVSTINAKNREYDHDKHWEKIRLIADWEDAEAEGRLVVLPCKVGDVVYMHGWLKATEYFSCHVDDDLMLIPSDVDLSDDEYGILEVPFEAWMYDDFGKTVFLTRAEAEAALAAERTNT